VPHFVTRMEVNLDNIADNFKSISRYVSPAAVIPVLKGNAYGHGAVAVARVLVEAGATHMAVAKLDEAKELVSAGVDTGKVDILIMTVTLPDEIKEAAELGISMFIPDLPRLQYVKSLARRSSRPVGFHIKVDTGMGRLGFMPDEAPQVAEELRDLGSARLIGIGSHLGASWVETGHSKNQWERFRHFVSVVDPSPEVLVHLAASGGTVRLPYTHMGAVRTGGLTYGLNRIPESPMELKPALAYKTTVGQIKTLPPGWQIGYGTEREVKSPMKTATVPAGALDGVAPWMAGRAHFLVNGVRCRLLTSSMDASIIDIGQAGDVKVGDEVVIIGTQGRFTITGRELIIEASNTGFGTHLGHISTRIPRIYYKNGEYAGMASWIAREGIAAM